MARSDLGSATSTAAARPAQAEHTATPPRRVGRHRPLPGSRALVGGLLMAVAAIGVLVAYGAAGDGPEDTILVAANTLRPGARIAAADLEAVGADLPPGSRAFQSVDDVVGKVVLSPVAAGEIIQASALTDTVAEAAAHEVALNLPRGQVAVGRLKAGERIDIYVTDDDRTASVVRGATVVQIGSSDGSLTSDREVNLVVAVPSGDAVAATVHALRTGDVTVVRSTLGGPAGGNDPLVFEPEAADTGAAVESGADDEDEDEDR